ncbi:cytochrome c family protein [Algoriphagus machipongonensis]|uniref:Cytochrome c family protein n=2 Tax=Algoriphagus machipongonensis TaxID=388413 RepID=A3HZB0_9BACT|nr:cytochrome c family protein [Algoriphagus machipongonensis]
MILSACTQKPSADTKDTSLIKEKDYIRVIEGIDEPLDHEMIQRGEVLISYSDCSECHKDDMRSKGPAFRDIAKRYPTSQVYLDLLARKVISGGTGSWGNPIMSPHPEINEDDAKAMVSYILSLED